MKIIEKIDINYFRSIYSIAMPGVNDVNIFYGPNDSGKSNILKSLNLFFNNDTELDEPFDFFEDLSKYREQEARDVKGRATVWIKITFRNFLDWKSLPETFSVKKTWNRYEPFPHQDIYPQNLTATTIGKYLARLAFHYTPAVRGRDIFAHYLGLLHDSLMDDERAGMRNASASLIDEINKSISKMSSDIRDNLGFESSIQMPDDLRDLFEALDFSTSFSGYKVALQRRGDGIQARHIPFILHFIAQRSRKYHIWAYEEPENSLEMRRAFDLAAQFHEQFSKENQIFITTHSPAFYDISGENVKKWFVSSRVFSDDNRAETVVVSDTGRLVPDQELGIAALISKRAKVLHRELDELKENLESLNEAVRISSLPKILVEGKSDKIILNAAAEKLFSNQDNRYSIIAANGSRNISQYIKNMRAIGGNDAKKIVGVFDNDHAGRKEMREFNQFHFFRQSGFRSVSEPLRMYVGPLPIPDHLKTIMAQLRRFGADEHGVPLVIEFMFPKEFVNHAIDAGCLILEDRISRAKDGEFDFQINISDQLASQIPEEYRYLTKKPTGASKIKFAELASGWPAEAYEPFRPLFNSFDQMF